MHALFSREDNGDYYSTKYLLDGSAQLSWTDLSIQIPILRNLSVG